MEKIKVNIPRDEFNSTMNVSAGDVNIEVRSRITYEEKQRFAVEYAQRVCVLDEEEKLAYTIYDEDDVEKFLFLKYFTNVDVEAFDNEISDSADFVELYLKRVIYDNECFDDAVRKGITYVSKTIEIYKRKNSLAHRIMHSFGSILNAEDLPKQLSESKGLNDELIDVLAKLKLGESDVVSFADFAKKINR